MRSFILLCSLLASAACTTEIPSDPASSGAGGKGDFGHDDGFCTSDAGLIAAARNALIRAEPSVYSADSFTSEGRTENLEDLNGDGLNDLAVYPGIQYASGNEEIVIMHGNPDTDCINPRVLGNFAAMALEVVPQGPDAAAGPMNLLATSNDGCERVTTWYSFDGTKYVAVRTNTDRSACD
jgi:hypothetical protein